MANPRVYVGTYGKYNRGSLAGGWLSLKECKDYQDFLRKCGRLHRGEHDPEFMIQDCEDFPDGLNCGEWLSEQDFKDVIAACEEEERQESVADRLRVALRERLKADGKAVPADDEQTLLEEYMKEYEKVWPDDKSMLDYCRKEFSGAVRLQNGGILYFEKPSIKTEFCFGYSTCGQGAEYDEANNAARSARTEGYFLHANLDEMDERIRALELNCCYPEGEWNGTYDNLTWYIQRKSYCSQKEELNLFEFRAWREYDVENEPWRYTPGSYEKMSDADRMTILGGMKREREKFEKRLRAYLKRYGTTKLRTWTYWLDE